MSNPKLTEPVYKLFNALNKTIEVIKTVSQKAGFAIS